MVKAGGVSRQILYQSKDRWHSYSRVPMPPTQTTCHATGTARAAVFALLAAGSHQNIV
ncbi:MAG TPA: hypothetical protein VKR83_19215 [Ktedonobacteraceae bacterium]|nr:hypothetical protein [Ktedonobacteraceae bacterium]